MSAWLGGFDGGLARGVPATGIEGTKKWLFEQGRYPGLRLVALHNSDLPDITMTDHTPGGYDQRQRNVSTTYKKARWRGGPAFNVYPDGTTRGGTPWGVYGVHSPSWNDYGIGIEMMADFDLGHDDDDAGKGLVEKNTACELAAAILFHHHLPVTRDTLKLHKQDKATDHDCPGADIEYQDVLDRVSDYYDALSTPGEHITKMDVPALDPDDPADDLKALRYVSSVDDLNVRNSGGMSGSIIAKIAKGQAVKVWSKAKNSSTVWAHVTGTKDGTNYFDGHVAFAYLRDAPTGAPPAHAPDPAAPVQVPPAPATPAPATPVPTDRPYWAGTILMGVGWPAAWAAGAIGNAQVESYRDLRVKAAGDVIGGQATAYTIWQLRNERHANFKLFALLRDKSEDDFETQVLWPTAELPESEHLAWKWLQRAITVDDATAAMAFYERPAGYISHAAKAAETWDEVKAVAEKVSHWDWRLKYAKALYARLA
jgi:hypothetical protein